MGSNITALVIFPNFICGLLKCFIQKFTLKYISDKMAKQRYYVLCCPVIQRLITVSQCSSNAPRIPDSQACLKWGKVSLVHSWRAINVLPAYGSVLHGFGGYLLFFCPQTTLYQQQHLPALGNISCLGLWTCHFSRSCSVPMYVTSSSSRPQSWAVQDSSQANQNPPLGLFTNWN